MLGDASNRFQRNLAIVSPSSPTTWLSSSLVDSAVLVGPFPPKLLLSLIKVETPVGDPEPEARGVVDRTITTLPRSAECSPTLVALSLMQLIDLIFLGKRNRAIASYSTLGHNKFKSNGPSHSLMRILARAAVECDGEGEEGVS